MNGAPSVTQGAQTQGAEATALDGNMPPGVTAPGALPPATGGTLLGFQGPPTPQYVQSGKRRITRKTRIGVVLVVVLLVAGGASAYVVRMHKGGSSGSGFISGDALAAAQVNLAQGDVPGWKGVPGTIAGAIGAYGFRQASSGSTANSASGSSVVVSDAAGFARCMKLGATQADAALETLGFSQGLTTAQGETALASSPLFEDPSAPATATESSVIVLGSPSERVADASVFAERSFPGCYSVFLTAVVPRLIGGATSAIPFTHASVHAITVRSSVDGVSVRGFTETFFRKGRTSSGSLFGGFDVVSGGRMIAVFQTISTHSFPIAEGLRLLVAVEQNVAGESS